MNKKKKTRFPDDPQARRELENYENPIPSREYILNYLAQQQGLVTQQDLFQALNLASEQDEEALTRRLIAMQRDGQIVCDRRRRYGLPTKMDLIRGVVQAHRDGYGFVVPEDKSKDLFVSPKEMRKVLHGDTVLVCVTDIDDKGRLEGAIVEVLERTVTAVVGRLCLTGEGERWPYVIAYNKGVYQDIFISPESIGQAVDQDIVRVELIVGQPKRYTVTGRIVEVLGAYLEPGLEIDVAIASYNLPNAWSSAVTDALQNIPKDLSVEQIEQRVDLREKYFVTIDGSDAKDFDDAVYCETLQNGEGWRLWVAIADVSHYVQPKSPLDVAANERGTSVYFPGRVLPMLPEVLSNNLCSLKPNQDRLSLVCEMTIDVDGTLNTYQFCEAVIRSKVRFTYTQVSHLIEGDDGALMSRYADFLPHLYPLLAVYEALSVARSHRGAIAFDTVEHRIVFGKQKKIDKIVPIQRTVSHKLIEECMIAANVASARFLLKHKMPALYRVHESPDADRVQDVRKFLGEFGLSLEGPPTPEPADYARLVAAIGGRDDFYLIQSVLLRSMFQAVYAPDNIGHFGLALTEYTHFTSPIRRYPDLMVHRAIRTILRKKPPTTHHDEMVLLGEHCSVTERRADEATRDVVLWLKCEYMQDKIGEVFEGVIQGVTSFGLFVELKDLFVEGLLHVTELDNDFYHFDPARHCLQGEHTNYFYRLGDTIKVKVIRVNLDDKKIDFSLVQTDTKKEKKVAETKKEKKAAKKRKKKDKKK